MPSFPFVIPLLLIFQLADANFAVLDIFSSDADCSSLGLLGPVQASIRREVGVCWNLPPDIPASFHPTILGGRQSYRIELCDNTSPFLTTSISVYAERDCEGEGLVLDINDIIPSTCMGSMKMSCQESPVAIEEGWPSIEMWLPTVPTADAVAPDCMPDLHPPVVMSFRPECSLFKNNMAILTECTEEGAMALHYYQDVVTCPNSDVPPFRFLETSTKICQLAGEVFGNSAMEDPVTLCGCIPDLVGMTDEESAYFKDLMARCSVKFRCY